MAGLIFTTAFLLNWIWEISQLSLYAPEFRAIRMGRRLIHCFPATALDALFITGIYYVGVLIRGQHDWISHLGLVEILLIILVGALAAVVVERVALLRGWWDYGPQMPRLPGLRAGLLPVLQLSLLPIVTFLLVSMSLEK